MAVGVYLPVWGQQMEEGKVVKWLVTEGDRVEKGDPLVEVETEKITNLVESLPNFSAALHPPSARRSPNPSRYANRLIISIIAW